VDYVREIFNAMLNVDVNNTASGDAKKSLKLIMEAMELKSKFLRETEVSSEEEMKKIFESVFYAKKHFGDVLAETGLPSFRQAFLVLKEREKEYGERIAEFTSRVKGGDQEDMEDLAKEVIHYLEPESYPLWTRWIWNPSRNTGSINYVLKDGVTLKNEGEFLSAINELRRILEIFGLSSGGNYYSTSIFLVYAYVRYLDYTTHLAVDKKAAGLIPTHLTTTALVMGLKPYLKVIKLAHT
jgi:hypothetical protein